MLGMLSRMGERVTDDRVLQAAPMPGVRQSKEGVATAGCLEDAALHGPMFAHAARGHNALPGSIVYQSPRAGPTEHAPGSIRH